MLSPVELPPGLEPSPANTRPISSIPGGSWLEIELDGVRVYLNDVGDLFSRAKDAAIRDRFLDALYASGAQTGFAPLPLLSAMTMARTAIAHLGRGRIVNPPKYTASDWEFPAGADP